RLFAEPLAHAALWLMQLGLVLGTGGVLAGLSTGRTGLEFPLWAAVPVEAAFVCAAIAVVGTILLREERYAYVSLLYFAAAAIFSSLLYAVGNAPGFSGFLVLGTFAYGVGSVRSFSEVLAFTSFPDGTTALLLLG